MTRKSMLAATLCFGLAACQGGARQTGIDLAQDAAAGLQRNISAADLQLLRDNCTLAAPAVLAATDPAAPTTVKTVGVYPQAFCQEILAGKTPATANANSVPWLTKTLTVLKGAAQVAGYVLPFVLPLL